MTEKKNGDYEKPESHGEDEDLENVSGGGKPDDCAGGSSFWRDCTMGRNAQNCSKGPWAAWGCKKGELHGNEA